MTIIVKQFDLDVRLAGLVEKRKLIRPKIGIVPLNLWVTADMTPAGGLK